MASQRQHRSRLAERLGRWRRALARGSVLAGSVLALAVATPVNASVQLERQALEARVQVLRAMLQEPLPVGAAGSVAGDAPPLRTAQWFNWNNWNNWKNWGNWLNR